MTVIIGYEWYDPIAKQWLTYLATDSQTTWGRRYFTGAVGKPTVLYDGKVLSAITGRSKVSYLYKLPELKFPSTGLPFPLEKPKGKNKAKRYNKKVKQYANGDRARQKQELSLYLNGFFSEISRKHQAKHHSGSEEKGVHTSDATVIMLINTHLFIIHCDYAATATTMPYYSIGCGGVRAEAILDCYHKVKPPEREQHVVEMLRNAILLTCQRDNGCGPPAHVLRSDLWGNVSHLVFDQTGKLLEPEKAKQYGAYNHPTKEEAAMYLRFESI